VKKTYSKVVLDFIFILFITQPFAKNKNKIKMKKTYSKVVLDFIFILFMTHVFAKKIYKFLVNANISQNKKKLKYFFFV
jgi:hypothetical protein